MTQVATTDPGFWFPPAPALAWSPGSTDTTQLGPMDAAAEKVALMGHIWWNGAPGSAKTVSSAGGKMYVRTHSGSPTFNNGSTVIRAGIQDPHATNFPVEPDGTFDVYDDLTGGVDTITADTMLEVIFSSGTKNISNGQFICIVLDMTGRGGADTVSLGTMPAAIGGIPSCRNYTTSWQTAIAAVPIALVVADDGTLGYFDGGFFVSDFGGVETFQDSTNPDERGNVFSVPWDCKVNGFKCLLAIDAVTDDLQFDLYADPGGTPTSIISGPITFVPENFGSTGSSRRECTFSFPAVSLTRNTDYWIAIKATGTTTFSLAFFEFVDAAHRALITGAPNKGTRNAGAGAAAETTTIVYAMWVRISSLDDGDGTGSGGGGPLIDGRLVR